ncbi:DUF6776 family protein [Alteromonas sp. a30]|uniref:DUF6776 family protein n=1 Tax=Alteromonas sp. a30 TaxID=2730917 RepID=UPI00227FD1C1|nr:DUF6776 family protein [Alteromonas sp. a30]MCY7294615.1 hypothetical protein [Alteromonas sp. a30]
MELTSLKQRVGAFKYYLLIITLLFLSGVSGFWVKSFLSEATMEEAKVLAHSVHNLKVENESLVKQLNILGVELEVARMTNEQNYQLIQQELQAKITLKKQLSFYQKVMAPELEQEGFAIDSLNIDTTHSENYYRYTLVLMQYDKTRSTVKGWVDLVLKGSQNGRPAEYQLLDLMPNDADPISFSFRYFEVLKGDFKLPEGFMPERIEVKSTLSQAKWGKRHLDRSFDWVVDEPELAANT